MAAAAMMSDQNLEPRVARLESDVAHIHSDIAELKPDFREMRKDFSAMDNRIADLNRTLVHGLMSNRIWMLLQSAALLAVMARAFKWL